MRSLTLSLIALVTFVSLAAAAEKPVAPQRASIQVTAKGFEPDSVKLKKGVPAELTVTRKTDDTCANEIVVPDYGITKKLPLNQPVVVAFTPQKAGEVAFQCGDAMLRGKMLVQ